MGEREDIDRVLEQLEELARLSPEAYRMVLRHLDEYLEDARKRHGVSPLVRRSHRTT